MRQRRAWPVVEHAALLGPVRGQAVERVLEVADAEAGPVGDVSLRGWTERAQVTVHELGARTRRVDGLRLVVGLVPRRRSRRPERRLAGVEKVPVPARRVHHPAAVDLGEIRMRGPQVREEFRVTDRTVA